MVTVLSAIERETRTGFEDESIEFKATPFK
jgi:hypothetical protein